MHRAPAEACLPAHSARPPSLPPPPPAGKTTLLRLMAGLEEPTEGRVLFDGEDVTRLGVQDRDLGFVFQVRPLYCSPASFFLSFIFAVLR